MIGITIYRTEARGASWGAAAIRRVGCRQCCHRNLVRHRLSSFVASRGGGEAGFEGLMGGLMSRHLCGRRSRPDLFFSCRSRRSRFSVLAHRNALRGLASLAFFTVWASRNRQILAAKGSIKRPNFSTNYLANMVFLPLCRDADAISPCSQGGSGGRLGGERAGEGPGLLAGGARFAAEVTRLGARGGAV